MRAENVFWNSWGPWWWLRIHIPWCVRRNARLDLRSELGVTEWKQKVYKNIWAVLPLERRKEAVVRLYHQFNIYWTVQWQVDFWELWIYLVNRQWRPLQQECLSLVKVLHFKETGSLPIKERNKKRGRVNVLSEHCLRRSGCGDKRLGKGEGGTTRGLVLARTRGISFFDWVLSLVPLAVLFPIIDYSFFQCTKMMIVFLCNYSSGIMQTEILWLQMLPG